MRKSRDGSGGQHRGTSGRPSNNTSNDKPRGFRRRNRDVTSDMPADLAADGRAPRGTSRRRSHMQPEEPEVREEKKRSVHFRMQAVYAGVFISFTSLIFRLAYVQMGEGQKFRAEASTSALNSVTVLPARGRIYDSNGTLLAYDQPIYNLYLNQSQNGPVLPIKSIANQLAPIFHTTVKSIMQTIVNQQAYATITLFKDLTQQQIAYIIEHHSDLPGISIGMSSDRQYVYGDLAGHVLGYVGPITSSTKHYYVDQLNYLANEQVGETGIESEYNKWLEGTVGAQLLKVNPSGTATEAIGMNPAPVAGDNLKLTLDGHLQAVTQEDISTFINHSPYRNTINDAAAVMLDVKTGGVLSLVSYPYYNPNWYTKPGDFAKHAVYLATSGSQENNAIQNPNYPGSTVKPANLITGLEHGVITPTTAYTVPYSILIAGAMKHDDMPHGFVDDAKAIAVSSDVFFYQIGLWLTKWMGSSPSSGGGPAGGVGLQTWRDVDFAKGITALFDGEWRFGLGQLTGIDLPGEQTGNFYIMDANQQYAAVPFPLQQATKAVEKNGSYVNYSSPVSAALSAIGQEQQFTPIELAQYVATIANGGKRLRPHLLQGLYPPGLTTQLPPREKPITQIHPKVEADLHINPKYLAIAQQGMYGVCNDPLGTAYPDFVGAPYKAAGKTGTADIYLNGVHMTNSVFIAYAPFNHPQIAVAVMIPGGGYGAQSAAAVARNMMDTYFKEHHEFYPKSQWQTTAIPANWMKSSANTRFNAK